MRKKLLIIFVFVLPALYLLGTIAFVQFLDNNILMPRIVGSNVKINAMATIIGVLIGGALAEIPGMFISLPLMATLKVIFDHTHQFKQWAVVLGEDVPKDSPMADAEERQPDQPTDGPPEEQRPASGHDL